MSFKRGLLPRPVRRAMHPVRGSAGSVKKGPKHAGWTTML